MSCRHLSQSRHVQPQAQGCEECVHAGGRWVELRLCLSCGHVGCCDGSPGRHARSHYLQTGHSIVRSFRATDDWAWCYPDGCFLDPEWITQVLEANHRHQSRILAGRPEIVRPAALHGTSLF